MVALGQSNTAQQKLIAVDICGETTVAMDASSPVRQSHLRALIVVSIAGLSCVPVYTILRASTPGIARDSHPWFIRDIRLVCMDAATSRRSSNHVSR